MTEQERIKKYSKKIEESARDLYGNMFAFEYLKQEILNDIVQSDVNTIVVDCYDFLRHPKFGEFMSYDKILSAVHFYQYTCFLEHNYNKKIKDCYIDSDDLVIVLDKT